MIFCDLCKLSFASHPTWAGHLNGSKHTQLLALKKDRQLRAENSVFVAGFPKGTTEATLRNYFSKYGRLENLIVEKNKGVYAIVEFEEKQPAVKILNSKHVLGGNRLVIKPRRLKENGNNSRIPVQERICPSHAKIVEYLKNASNADEQMTLLTNILKLSDEEIRDRQKICEHFTEVFREHFAYAEVNLFGSTVNGLGMHGCDVDLLLSLKPEIDDTQKQFPVEKDQELLQSAKNAITLRSRKLEVSEVNLLQPLDIVSNLIRFIIKNRACDCSRILVIPSKRCPIVRFKINSVPQLSCDLSIKNRLSLYNSKLIHLYVCSDSRVMDLIFTIRYWAKRQQLHVDNGNRITSYAITMLVIFYLQNIEPAVLPTLTTLRSCCDFTSLQGGWDCTFCADPAKYPTTANSDSLTELLKGFFEFYCNFDFNHNVVCLCDGKSMSKDDVKGKISDLKISNICVQDPFELSHNTTGNLGETLSAKLIQAFQSGNEYCKSDSVSWSHDDTKEWGILPLFECTQTRKPRKPCKAQKSSTEHKESTKLSFDLFSSYEIEQMRGILPGTSNPATFDIKECFQRIFSAVKSVFEVGLQFQCTFPDEEERMPIRCMKNRKRSLEHPDYPKAKRSLNELVGTSSESCSGSEDLGMELWDEFECVVYYKTWIRRKKVKSQLSKGSLSTVEAEAMVSKQLIEKLGFNVGEPLYGFKCSVEMAANPQNALPFVKLTLEARSNSGELTGNLFIYLQSYVPKIIRQMQALNEI